jgi:hypothetical protein
MPGRMGCFALHMRELAHVVPDGVDVHGMEPAEALGFAVGREEECV